MSRYWTVGCMNPQTHGDSLSVVFGPLERIPTDREWRIASSLLSAYLTLSLAERLLCPIDGFNVIDSGIRYRMIRGMMDATKMVDLFGGAVSDTACNVK